MEKINAIQKKHHVPLQKEDAADEFNFGLMEVVFEWARGLVRTMLINHYFLTFKSTCLLFFIIGVGHSSEFLKRVLDDIDLNYIKGVARGRACSL